LQERNQRLGPGNDVRFWSRDRIARDHVHDRRDLGTELRRTERRRPGVDRRSPLAVPDDRSAVEHPVPGDYGIRVGLIADLKRLDVLTPDSAQQLTRLD